MRQKMLNWLREKVSSRESLGSGVPSALPGTEAGHSSYDSLSKGTSIEFIYWFDSYDYRTNQWLCSGPMDLICLIDKI